MATQRSSSLVCIARAGLTVAVALGLTTVFAGSAWLFPALIAAIAPHALFAWADAKKWPAWAGPLLSLVVAFVFTLYAVEPHTTRHGLPTGDTFHRYFVELGDSAHTLRTAVVPVTAVGSSLLLALVALWVAGAISEWSARRLDASLGAIGPTLVLFVAIAALGEGGRVGMTIVYGVAVTCYLVALHQSDMTERRSWFHATERRRSRVVQGGVIAGVAIVLLAALISPILPGSKSDPWFDYRKLGKDGGGGGLLKATTPIVSIQSKLLQNPDREVFTVDIGDNRPAYWRVIALDKYDGTLWTLEDTGESAEELSRPREPRRFDELVQRFTILDSEPHWLPAAYHPVEINLEHALAVPSSATLYLKTDDEIQDLSYQVTSAVPVFTEAQKLAAPPVVDARFARDLELPSDFPANIRALARQVTADATSPWQKAQALAAYFNSGDRFTYNDQVARSHSIRTLEQFLFETREGYCEQFASAFAAMARSIGLPTRVAVGYSYGTPQDGEWTVRNRDAHAWPEVYFSGLGWIPLEPTPGRGANATGGTGDPAERPAETATEPQFQAPSTAPTTAPPAGPNGTIPFRDPGSGVAVGDRGSTDPGTSSPVRQLALTLAVLVLLALLVALVGIGVLIFVIGRRTWRRRHAEQTRDRVLGAWAQALDHLAEAGVTPKPSATPLEFAMRHAPAHGAGDAGPPLMELAQLQTAALFSPAEPTPDDAKRAWDQVDAIDHAIQRTMSPVARWRRRLDPRRLRREELTPRWA
jgi:transglutaminase-like putative cysteine protease